MNAHPRISLIIPFYNEQESLPELMQRLQTVFNANPDVEWEALMVDDGSTDTSTAEVERMRAADPRFHSIVLSRNFGKEAAMLAGIDAADGDAAVILDADLQHPPETIPLMVAKWREGYDDVRGRRSRDGSSHSLRALGTHLFYGIMRQVADVAPDSRACDFRLLDRAVLTALRSMREQCRYTKGMFDYVGFRKASVDFDQQPRRTGRGKMRPGRLLSLAMTGLVSSGLKPLRWLWIVALLLLACGIVAALLPPGFPIMALIFILSAVQMAAIALVGEYVGRAAIDSRQRPPYIIAVKDGIRPA